ncbi:hypothetical protein OG548_42090 [Streptomyces sp. NBC_01356]|nr:hypothetical protein [Streptomyces sp. NBC_01356]
MPRRRLELATWRLIRMDSTMFVSAFGAGIGIVVAQSEERNDL